MLFDIDAIGNRFAERPAAIFPSGTLSFAELAERVRARVRDLVAHGVTADDRVGVVCGRDADTIVSILSIYELGSALLPFGAELPAPAGERLVASFRAGWVVEEGQPVRVVSGASPAAAGAVVLALASSGSTGTPKLALISVPQLRARDGLYTPERRFGGEDRTLMTLPLPHASGMHFLVASVRLGAGLVFAPNSHPRTVVRACAEQGVTVLPGPPMVFDLLAQHQSEDRAALAGVSARSGAGGLSLETHRAFTDAFQIPLWQFYGASEAGTVCVNCSGASHGGRMALGPADEDVEVRVCDERGAELPDGEVGELVVRSPRVALGYAGASEGGSRIEDGCFFTGDLGERIDGLFYFSGRSKLLIDVAGHKVDVFEVEEVLRRHPSVEDAAVVAHASASRDVVKAIVVVREPVGVEALTDFCSRELAPYQVPRLVEFCSELPRNELGKLQRERL
jgi:acyl-CoA synthetase (AMP-forming)/AMP-acid ligase II